MAITFQSVDRNQHILNRDALQCRSTRDIQESASILATAFSIALRDDKRNGLSCAKPMIASGSMSAAELIGVGKRLNDVIN
jgi:hypothetical protein